MNKSVLLVLVLLVVTVSVVDAKKPVLQREAEDVNDFGQDFLDWLWNNLILFWIQCLVYSWIAFIGWWAALFGDHEWAMVNGVDFWG